MISLSLYALINHHHSHIHPMSNQDMPMSSPSDINNLNESESEVRDDLMEGRRGEKRKRNDSGMGGGASTARPSAGRGVGDGSVAGQPTGRGGVTDGTQHAENSKRT